MAEETPVELNLKSHSSVACIVRQRDPLDDANFEILFMLRAKMEGDRWSGQVAFPGGKQDKTDKSLRHTAERETMEELGLDLTKGFDCLGKLTVIQATKTLDLSCYVYVQTVATTPKLTLSESEVASVAWVPVRATMDTSNKTYLNYPPPEELRTSFRVLGVESFQFRGVDLGHHGNDKYVLWGLTMRLTAHLLLAAGFHSEHLTKSPNFYFQGRLGRLHSAIARFNIKVYQSLGVKVSWDRALISHLMISWAGMGCAGVAVARMVSKL